MLLEKKVTSLLSIGLLFIAFSKAYAEEDAKWVEIFHKIYDTNPETATLSPEDTRVLLTQFEKELSNDDSTHQVDNMVIAFDKINALLEVSEISERKCTGSAFEDIKEIMKIHESLFWNVMRYLKYYQSLQYARCKPELTALILDADEKFSEDEQVEIAILVKDIQEYNKGRLDGLKIYIESKVGPMSKYRNRREEFIQAYESTAGGLCRKVVAAFREPMSIYKHLIDQEEVVSQWDEITFAWVNKAQVCKYLVNTMEELIDSPSRALVSLINKPMILS